MHSKSCFQLHLSLLHRSEVMHREWTETDFQLPVEGGRCRRRGHNWERWPQTGLEAKVAVNYRALSKDWGHDILRFSRGCNAGYERTECSICRQWSAKNHNEEGTEYVSHDILDGFFFKLYRLQVKKFYPHKCEWFFKATCQEHLVKKKRKEECNRWEFINKKYHSIQNSKLSLSALGVVLKQDLFFIVFASKLIIDKSQQYLLYVADVYWSYSFCCPGRQATSSLYLWRVQPEDWRVGICFSSALFQYSTLPFQACILYCLPHYSAL